MSNAIARKLESLHRKGAMRNVDVANLLGAAPDQVARWDQGRDFPVPEARKRLVDAEFIVDQLSDLYEPEEARQWLFTPQPRLNHAIPATLIQQGRVDEVQAVLNQLLDGTYV
ncbi:DUF2384 domain-containing protein [Azospirillum humicireducens]|uniref:DUF2384 domain-containing protein n=1 Tax=Azospirillum humicireducens TaxID=1226968 RepID=A0A160JDM4_9PROT|nr:antitoxin Xre/MbcA/ParS toxin-binding domain-containing protein [Azospirillum humicireducens]ANC90504.1 DUF2384 domain-containing protein [Azospirillum humicireducens]